MKEAQFLLSTSSSVSHYPDRIIVSEETKQFIQKITDNSNHLSYDMSIDDLKIPCNFIHTAPVYQGDDSDGYDGSIPVARGSNQTDDYIKLLRLDHIITIPYQSSESPSNDPNEVDIDDI